MVTKIGFILFMVMFISSCAFEEVPNYDPKKMPEQQFKIYAQAPIPATAKNVKFVEYGWQDSYIYYYFEDTKQNANEFSKKFIGHVLLNRETNVLSIGDISEEWWIKNDDPKLRTGRKNTPAGTGDRLIMILDGEPTKIWVSSVI